MTRISSPADDSRRVGPSRRRREVSLRADVMRGMREQETTRLSARFDDEPVYRLAVEVPFATTPSRA